MPKRLQPLGHGLVVPAEILTFVALRKVRRREGLEPDEEAPQPGLRRLFDEVPGENGIDGRCALKQPVHAAHAVEERAREPAIAQQMIIEEVEVPAGKPLDLGEGLVDALRIERATALEKRILVAEVAMMRTSAGDDDGVGHEIAAPLDEVAPDWRRAVQRPIRCRPVDRQGPTRAKVAQESRKRLLGGSEEDGIRVPGGLVGQRGHVQAAERHEGSARPVVVGDPVRAQGVGDVNLNQHEIRPVVDVQRCHVLVHQHRFVVRIEEGRERGQPEWRKQGVLDRTPVWIGGFGEGRQDQLHM